MKLLISALLLAGLGYWIPNMSFAWWGDQAIYNSLDVEEQVTQLIYLGFIQTKKAVGGLSCTHSLAGFEKDFRVTQATCKINRRSMNPEAIFESLDVTVVRRRTPHGWIYTKKVGRLKCSRILDDEAGTSEYNCRFGS